MQHNSVGWSDYCKYTCSRHDDDNRIFGVVLPYHPFDYIYNHLVRRVLDKPRLPRRSNQLKFACGVATIWIAATIYLFYYGFAMAGYVAGGMLFSVAFLVSTTDICIPSIIYNFLFKIKV